MTQDDGRDAKLDREQNILTFWCLASQISIDWNRSTFSKTPFSDTGFILSRSSQVTTAQKSKDSLTVVNFRGPSCDKNIRRHQQCLLLMAMITSFKEWKV